MVGKKKETVTPSSTHQLLLEQNLAVHELVSDNPLAFTIAYVGNQQ